jgi:hypothetical protein
MVFLMKLGDTEIKSYKAGDRIIIRSPCELGESLKREVIKSVQKAADGEVAILVVDCSRYRILRFRKGEQVIELAGKQYLKMWAGNGTQSLGVSKVDIYNGDEFVVVCKGPKEVLSDSMRHWVKDNLVRYIYTEL